MKSLLFSSLRCLVAFLVASLLFACDFSERAQDEDEEDVEYVEQESLPDLLRKLEEFQKNQPPKGEEIWVERTDAMRAYEAASVQVDIKAVSHLVAFYKGINEKERFFAPLVLALIRLELAQIAAEKPRPLVLPTVTIPEEPQWPLHNEGTIEIAKRAKIKNRLPLRPEAPELRAAWKTYLGSRKMAEGVLEKIGRKEPTPESITYYDNRDAFALLLEDVLERRDGGHVEQLLAYHGGGYSKMMALFLALLRERRLAEAVGIVYEFAYAEEAFYSPPNGKGFPTRRIFKKPYDVPDSITLLKICGLDWEKIFLGALVDEEVFYNPVGISLGLHSDAGNPLLIAFAIHGSEKNVPLLLKLMKIVPDKGKYIVALSTYIQPGAGSKEAERRSKGYNFIGNISFGMSQYYFPRQPPASKKLQKKILADLQAIALQPDTSFANVQTIARLFEYARRPETRDTLHQSLKHPSSEVAKTAVRALENLGETALLPPPPPPVRFLLTHNGEPLWDFPLRAWLYYAAYGTEAQYRTDADGVFTIEREAFLDPANKFERLDIRPKGDYNRKVANLYFLVKVPPPDDFDTLITVPIETHPLKLHFTPNRDVYDGKTIRMEIRKAGEYDNTDWLSGGEMNVPFQAEIVLPAVQTGAYEIETILPHAAHTRTRIEHLQAEPHEIKLSPGATLKWNLIKPNDPWGSLDMSLTKDGEPFANRNYIYPRTTKGLPAGNYVFHAKHIKNARRKADMPTLDYEPLEIPFVVDENSPAEIDLGELRLKEVASD